MFYLRNRIYHIKIYNLLYKILLFLLIFLTSSLVWGQDSLLMQFPSDYLSIVSKKMNDLEQKLDKGGRKALENFQKCELRIYRRLLQKDSVSASLFLHSAQQQYQQQEQKLLSSKEVAHYLPFLDTLKTSLSFLDENRELACNIPEVSGQVKEAMEQVQQMEGGLAKAEQIEQFIKQRRAQIREQLGSLLLGAELKKINKQVYYYSAQLSEYKELIKDRRKVERKALALLTKHPAFKKYFARNSQFASLFRIPEDGSGNVSLDGLQTRAAVQQLVYSKVGNGGSQFLQAQLNTAQKATGSTPQVPAMHLAKKKKSRSDFAPNSQKTKPLLKRLEYGSNVQFGKVNQLLPTTADLAISVGYKLNDAGTIGVGSSYKLGLGRGLGHIRFSDQGYTLRSFIDWRLKGNFYITGGYEQLNLVQLPSTASHPVRQWQESGLIGASRKYTISPRLKGNLQLMFDFLSYQSIPKRQPIIFRTGWHF